MTTTERPTHLRIFTDGSEWFVDGADDDGNFTEGCWSFCCFEDAVVALPNFVTFIHEDYGISWDWRAGRQS